MKEIAEVVAVDGHRITLSTELKSACSGCVQKSTCGAGILSHIFADRNTQFTVESDVPVRVGEQVQLTMHEADFTRYALLLYGLPILVLLLLAMLLSALGTLPEWTVILLAFSGFAASFLALKQWFKRRDVKVQQLIRVTQAEASASHTVKS
ncbi:SoxR reducing system RseC family protein [Idiomarina aquatica]|uniref:Fis family transcriptional regulator n=1 Tax=Idiomarina aquatica TaxID=1327752 RepID=A0AA94EF62_9GAMM|nr:SoxR reducing system RseC family protein [Idiomarina aquatica]RUO44676.1 Fis family transcriptional regulator [Idiomarina aquatica]